MEQLLMRRVKHPDAKQGTGFIQANISADRYTYSHVSYREQVEATGKMIYSYANLFHLNDKFESEWADHPLHQWWHYCNDNDLWLRNHSGEVVRFPYFGCPRLVNMAKITDYDMVHTLDTLMTYPRPFFLDQVRIMLADWMLKDNTVQDLVDYSPIAYMLGVKRYLNVFQSGGETFLNGWNDGDQHGHLVMYENADTGRRLKDLGWTVCRWQQNPGSILEIEGGPELKSTQRVLEVWRQGGGILGCQHPDTAELAWEMKR